MCAAIERFQVQILPTSPTFLNLLLLSGAYERHDLSSLELVTYGTEVMPEPTLARLHEILPRVRLLQTYGLSEVGILRSKSKSSDSLWVKVGGEGFQTRIVDGMLEIKAQSAMLGYLNAPSPFSEDGWFKTGDAVEVEGEYIRILGRQIRDHQCRRREGLPGRGGRGSAADARRPRRSRQRRQKPDYGSDGPGGNPPLHQ